jgi:hypothetical protein
MVCALFAGAAAVHCGTPTFIVAGDGGTDGTITKPDTGGSGSTSGSGAVCSFAAACAGDASCCLTATEILSETASTCTPGFGCATGYRVCDTANAGSDCPGGKKCCAPAGALVGACAPESLCAALLPGSGSGTSGSSPGSGSGSAPGSGSGSEGCRGPRDCPAATTTRSCCSTLETGDGGACSTSGCGTEHTRCGTPGDCPSTDVCCLDTGAIYGFCLAEGDCRTLYGSGAVGRCNPPAAIGPSSIACGNVGCGPEKCAGAGQDWNVCDWSAHCTNACGSGCGATDLCCVTADGGAACVPLLTCFPSSGSGD